ncbi:MAG: nucleotide-binding protein, partial [Methanomicrobiales archaeon]|nr:nucleotide-binding protein [Methanomicrobiales archaeon]
LSWGSALLILTGDEEEVEIEGTVIATAEGACIDTGDTCYLLTEPLPIGYEVRARGTVCRGVISISHVEAVCPDQEDLQRRLDQVIG